MVTSRNAILGIAWHVLAKGTTYPEQDHATRRYVRLLENLGHRITLDPAPVTA